MVNGLARTFVTPPHSPHRVCACVRACEGVGEDMELSECLREFLGE